MSSSYILLMTMLNDTPVLEHVISFLIVWFKGNTDIGNVIKK
jgi:hypothetical protein